MRNRFPSTRKLILMLGDVALLLLSVVIVLHEYYSSIPYNSYMYLAPVIAVSGLVIFNINGLFSLARKLFSEVFINLLVAQFQLALVMMAASFLFKEFEYSRMVIMLSAVVQFVFLALWQYAFWRTERMLVIPKDALLLGSEESCARVLLALQTHPHLRYKVKYVLTQKSEDDWQGITDNVDIIIICDGMDFESKAKIVHLGHMQGKQIFIVPAAYDLFCNGAVLDKIDDIPVFRPRYLKPTLEQRILKRVLDMSVSATSLLFLSPLFLVIAILVKMDSPGAVFYRQIRLGRNETEFSIFKFRTMREDAESTTGPVMAGQDDPRVTKFGNFLRKTRLDELPQLINVLRGEMSIVGPRPERPFFVAQFKQEIPEYVYRHNVKPGITGNAQVYGKYNTPAYDKLVYDLIYMQKFSLAEDLRLMLKTLRVLVNKHSTDGVVKELPSVNFAKPPVPPPPTGK